MPEMSCVVPSPKDCASMSRSTWSNFMCPFLSVGPTVPFASFHSPVLDPRSLPFACGNSTRGRSPHAILSVGPTVPSAFISIHECSILGRFPMLPGTRRGAGPPTPSLASGPPSLSLHFIHQCSILGRFPSLPGTRRGAGPPTPSLASGPPSLSLSCQFTSARSSVASNAPISSFLYPDAVQCRSYPVAIAPGSVLPVGHRRGSCNATSAMHHYR